MVSGLTPYTFTYARPVDMPVLKEERARSIRRENVHTGVRRAPSVLVVSLRSARKKLMDGDINSHICVGGSQLRCLPHIPNGTPACTRKLPTIYYFEQRLTSFLSDAAILVPSPDYIRNGEGYFLNGCIGLMFEGRIMKKTYTLATTGRTSRMAFMNTISTTRRQCTMSSMVL